MAEGVGTSLLCAVVVEGDTSGGLLQGGGCPGLLVEGRLAHVPSAILRRTMKTTGVETVAVNTGFTPPRRICDAKIAESGPDAVPAHDELFTAWPENGAGRVRIPTAPGGGPDLDENVPRRDARSG